MLAGIASMVFIPLLTVSMVHFIWALGFIYPAREEKVLAQTVVGIKGIEKMPPRIASLAVSFATFFAGIWALALSDPNPNNTLILGGIVAAVIFVGRGIAGYTPQWRANFCEEPFATFDRKLYSPLCLAIGFGFAILTILNAF